MDKFLIADNPLRDDSGLWVIHLLNPRAILRCSEGHVKFDTIHRHYTYQRPDGIIELWTLSTYHLFTTDFLTEPEEQAGPLLDRAWRWFRSYLDWENEESYED